MCGICGFYKLNKNQNRHIDEKSLIDMNNEMILRGPDGGNVWLEKNNRCGLGNELSHLALS